MSDFDYLSFLDSLVAQADEQPNSTPADPREYVEQSGETSTPVTAADYAAMEAPVRAPASSPRSDEVADFIRYRSLMDKEEEKLRDARKANSARAKDLNLFQAVGDLGAGLAGEKVDPAYYNAARAQGAETVKGVENDVERRRKLVQDFMTNKRMEETAREARAARAEAHSDAMELKRIALGEKKERENELLQTPYGLAHTPDDAKQLKQASELKEKFDRNLQEMIDLRTKHGGGAVLNRDDVARGEQLAKDTLLLYKDLANLGVLSKSDEAILNAIIPSDPLEFNLSGIFGQDPTMSRLKKFQGDVGSDFQTKLNTRLRTSATPSPAASPNAALEAEMRRRGLLK